MLGSQASPAQWTPAKRKNRQNSLCFSTAGTTAATGISNTDYVMAPVQIDTRAQVEIF
jgi:hypothetical protein